VTNNLGADPELATIATSLAEELPLAPPADDIYEEILIALRVLHGRVAEEGFAALADDINRHWGGTREIELSIADQNIRGTFLGIDSRGDLLVAIDGHAVSHSAPHVQLMREI